MKKAKNAATIAQKGVFEKKAIANEMCNNCEKLKTNWEKIK